MSVAELTREDLDEPIKDVMSMLTYRMAKWAAGVEIMAEQFHTCGSCLRYPWPPEKGCPGCEHEIQKWVRRLHLQVPYLLFGWDAVVKTAQRNIQLKIDKAQARRNMGAGI